jgi:hypothetical protein
MVQDLSEGRFSKNQLTAEERRIWDGYNAALSRIETPHFDDAETRRAESERLRANHFVRERAPRTNSGMFIGGSWGVQPDSSWHELTRIRI